MCAESVFFTNFGDELVSSKFTELLDRKTAANDLYKSGKYGSAAEQYSQIISCILELPQKDLNVGSIKDVIVNSGIKSEKLKQFLSTLLCNLALCFYNQNMVAETQILCETCLFLDEYNYKAAYHLANSHFLAADYNTSLRYIQRCQQIVFSRFPERKEREQPHLSLFDKIRKQVHGEYSRKTSYGDLKEILDDIVEGKNVNLNLQKLDFVSKMDVAQKNSIERLIDLAKEKTTNRCIDDTLLGIWSAVYQILIRVDTKKEDIIFQKFMDSFPKGSGSLSGYVMDLFKILESNPSLSSAIQCIVAHLSKCCAIVNSIECLRCLYIISEKGGTIFEAQVLTSIMLFFTRPNLQNKQSIDVDFNNLLSKLLEHLISLCDLDNDISKSDQLDACFIAIFRLQFRNYQISADSFKDIISRLLSIYVNLAPPEDKTWVGVKILEPTWYIVVRCLFVANQSVFKAYFIENDLFSSLLVNYLIFYSSEVNMHKLRILASQIIVYSMDFPEFRQHLIDACILDKYFLEHLSKDACFVDYLNGIKDIHLEHLSDNSKSVPERVFALENIKLHEYKLLMLSKITIHSISIKKKVLSSIDLFSVVPRLLVFNIKAKEDIEVLVECLSYLTLHGEFKSLNDFGFIVPLLIRLDESREKCNGKILYMTCQLIVNLMRSTNDSFKFLQENNDELKLDNKQINDLRSIYNKIPDVAKPLVNGSYNEGSDQLAFETRRKLFSLPNHILPKFLVNFAKSTAKENSGRFESVVMRGACNQEIAAYTAIVECFHHLIYDVDHRRTLQSMGALRILINAATSDCYKNTNKQRFIAQSIAHLCITSNPANISYGDASDSVGPLIIILNDDDQLFQYESALGLTNLLSTCDEIRKRVWDLKGWDLFGNLLYSENNMLKAAGLEGWCNLCAGEGLVHGHFYAQIIRQVEAHGDSETLLDITIHDINIMLAFSIGTDNKRAVVASTGSLAMLARDLRIAQYMPFMEKFANLFKAIDVFADESILHRILTIFSCVIQGSLKTKKINNDHIMEVKSKIKNATRRNRQKYIDEAILKLAKEIETFF